MDATLGALLVCLAFLVIIILSLVPAYRKATKVAKVEAVLKCHIEKKREDLKDIYILHVDEQNKLFADVLEMHPHKISQYKDHPVKLHIGSATVGGVTTGGVYTTGGGTTKSWYRSEKMELVYMHSKGRYCQELPINRIVLSAPLAKKCRDSEIASYIDGNTIQLIHKVQYSYYAMFAMQRGYTTQALNRCEIEDAQGYPTGEECEKIIRWLCGE